MSGSGGPRRRRVEHSRLEWRLRAGGANPVATRCECGWFGWRPQWRRRVILVGYAVGNATWPATPGPNYGQPGGKIGPPAYSPTPGISACALPPYTHVDPNEFQSSSGDSNNWKPYVPPKPSAPAGDDDDDSSDGTSGPPPNFARSPLGPQNYPQPHSDHPEPTEWYPSRRPPGGGKIPGATGPRQPGGPSGGPRILNPPNYPQPHSDHPEPTEWYPSAGRQVAVDLLGATAPPKRSDLPGSSYQPGRSIRGARPFRRGCWARTTKTKTKTKTKVARISGPAMKGSHMDRK